MILQGNTSKQVVWFMAKTVYQVELHQIEMWLYQVELNQIEMWLSPNFMMLLQKLFLISSSETSL